MITVLTGESDYAIKAAAKILKNEFVQKHGEQSTEQRDGSSLVVADLPQLFQGASLFSPQRLVLIRELGTNKSVWEALPEYLPEDSDVRVVMIEPRLDKRTRTYKWLQKHADIKQHNLPSEADLVSWIQAHGRDLGINLENEMVRLLLSYVGADQWRLHHEIEKLSLAKRPVSRELIEDVIDPNPQATAFELLDATIAGKANEVQRLVAIVRRTEDPYKFVGLLTSQVYALAVCRAAGDRPAATIAKDAGLHPYVASKALAIARRLNQERLSGIVATIAELDVALKSSGGTPWMLIEASLIKIATR